MDVLPGNPGESPISGGKDSLPLPDSSELQSPFSPAGGASLEGASVRGYHFLVGWAASSYLFNYNIWKIVSLDPLPSLGPRLLLLRAKE